MVDNHSAILAILDKRMREAEQTIITSEPFKRLKARNAHILWEHGSGELCTCPEWNDGRPI